MREGATRSAETLTVFRVVLWSRLQSVQSLVDGVNVCTVVGLPVHAAAPYSCRGGRDGVVLNDLLLGARRRWAACRAALWA